MNKKNIRPMDGYSSYVVFTLYSLSSERRMISQHSLISASDIVSGGEMRKAVSQ